MSAIFHHASKKVRESYYIVYVEKERLTLGLKLTMHK